MMRTNADNCFRSFFVLFGSILGTLIMFLLSVVQISAQVQYPYYFPSKERLTRINLEVLPLSGYGFDQSAKIEKLEELYTSHSVKDFIAEENAERDCRSVLREGYKCYEIENMQIGYESRIADYYPYPISRGYFRTIDPQSKTLQIFYHTAKNQFFLKPSKRGDKIYGPFKGEPLTALKKSEFSIKERSAFPGVEFTYLSKRWEFPDEKDAMLDRNSPDYDFIGGRISGREVEDMRLKSQFVKFRLENKSGSNLYFLFFGNEPEVFQLDKFPEWKSWRRQTPPKFNSESDYNLNQLNWASLPNNSAVEFETKAGCDVPQICAIGIYLNDARSFWDEIEMFAIYPSRERREFNPQNTPPKRK